MSIEFQIRITRSTGWLVKIWDHETPENKIVLSFVFFFSMIRSWGSVSEEKLTPRANS